MQVALVRQSAIAIIRGTRRVIDDESVGNSICTVVLSAVCAILVGLALSGESHNDKASGVLHRLDPIITWPMTTVETQVRI